MNTGIILRNDNGNDRRVEALVSPEQGMTLQSFRTNNIEVIAQRWFRPFCRFAGEGGPLIGPYFYRPEVSSPCEKNGHEQRIYAVAPKGSAYVPWHYENNGSRLCAMLCGADRFNDRPLRDIHGGDFEFNIDFNLMEDSLRISFEAQAEFLPSIGLWYHYALPMGKGRLYLPIQNDTCQQDKLGTLPDYRIGNQGQMLDLVLDQSLDHVFPICAGEIAMATDIFFLRIIPEEGVRSLIVHHSSNDDLVCIAPTAGEKQLCHVQKIIVRLKTELLN